MIVTATVPTKPAIAAARNNSFGSRGVAAGAPVVPVRVFGCSGGSASSTIISGINHVATYDYVGDFPRIAVSINCKPNFTTSF